MDLQEAITYMDRYHAVQGAADARHAEARDIVLEAARKQAEADTMAKYPPIGASYHAYHRTAGITESLLCEVCRG
jgi:hypothetical protein